jgi:hypothetical protein
LPKVSDKMRFQFRVYPIAAAILSASGFLLPDQLAAQQITQCYVEDQPCGTLEHLRKLISDCLQDPDLCRHAKRRSDIVTDASEKNTYPAAGRSSRALPSSSQSPTGSRTLLLANGRTPTQQKPSAVDSNSGAEPVDVEKAAIPAQTISEVARQLPLDSAVRNLTNAMPTNAASIERRLGLRRTRVAGFDLRDKIPSPDEIVQALAPTNGVQR